MSSDPGRLDLGMGGHHRPNRGEKDEWLTPPPILDALGPFFAAMDDARWMILGPAVEGSDQ